MTTIAPPTNDLESEIQQLKVNLATAVASQVTPEAKHEQELRQQLANKQAELLAAQHAEGLELGKQQRQKQLQTLADVEKELTKAKAEVTALRTMLAELPAKLSRAEYALNELLRGHSKLRQELGL